MSFIDDDLLWCPDNDGKLIDLACLDAAAMGGGSETDSQSVQSCNTTSPNMSNMNSGNNHNLNSFSVSLGPDHDPMNQQQTMSQSHHGHNNNSRHHPYNLQMSQRSSNNDPAKLASLNNHGSYSINGNMTSHASCNLQNNIVNSTNNQQHPNGTNDHTNNSELELPTLSPLSPADLNGFVCHLDEDDDDDLLKQLGETSFELEAILDEFVDENNPNHSQHQFNSYLSSHHHQHNAHQQNGVPSSHPGGTGLHNNQQNHLQNGHCNVSNGNGMNNGLPTQCQLDDRSESLLAKRRKKNMNKCDLNMDEVHRSLSNGQGTILSTSNNAHRNKSMVSILQNQLCQPHHTSDVMGRLNKVTIASANPLLAEKLAAPMTPVMGEVHRHNGMNQRGMDHMIEIKTECGSPENIKDAAASGPICFNVVEEMLQSTGEVNSRFFPAPRKCYQKWFSL
ncbi:unnamed protein product [Allacma fusca]|uniref:Uncharacterized protein n=1 Tax=Allacma fusca TaxID=39272 RepID=A0A8J2K2E9_9HEXA|nr:unnamed protein product [Allacma fusca]